jgi:glycosyltransferase involved in cell wall biosynthesis
MDQNNLKVAIVHDYIKEFGGAESVLETLSDIFPDAPIFTSLYCPRFLGPHQNRLEKKWRNRIHQSFFRFIPFFYKIISPLRLLSPLAFGQFNFSGYDVIISSATGAYFPNSVKKGKAKLICYCHTPPRYLYGLPTARNLSKNKLVYFLVQIINHYLRLLDYKISKNVDLYIANSETTKKRIEKYYRRQALVVNPPIDFPETKSHITNHKSDFFLTGGRLARAKRYDVAINACNKLSLNLKIFGRDFAGFANELKNISGPTIEFLGEISQSQKSKLYSEAKAFIFCSDNEDFGMMPVEAMAYGCPVVAYKSGGVTETVINGKTGLFFDVLSEESCAEALNKINKTDIYPENCYLRAQEFTRSKFIEKIKKIIFSN